MAKMNKVKFLSNIEAPSASISGSITASEIKVGNVAVATVEDVQEALTNGGGNVSSGGSDWNQNDETAKDYIKNRTHYINKTTTKKTYAENISVPGDDGPITFQIFNVVSVENETFSEGTKLTVVINNSTTYAGTLISNGDSSFYFGNENIGSDEVTEDDYCVHLDQWDESSWNISVWLPLSFPSPSTFTVYSFVEETQIVPLEEKFIPEQIARKTDIVLKTVNGKQPDNYNINLSYDDLENKPFYTYEGRTPLGEFDGSSFEFLNSDSKGDYYLSQNSLANEMYHVVWDGIETEAWISYKEDSDGGIYCCYGDPELIGTPYYIETDPQMVTKVYSADASSHTIKISSMGSEMIEMFKPIDEKYIPDTIARSDRYEGEGEGSFVANETVAAISNYSTATGFNTVAGSKAFNVQEIIDNNDGTGQYVLSSIEGLGVGMHYLASTTNMHYNPEGKITNIEGFNVTVDNFVFSPLRINADGLVRGNYLLIVDNPNLGDIDIGKYASAQGHTTKALGIGSHAEGGGTTKDGVLHVNIASGIAAHAEGVGTIAIDQAAHAEGRETVASGDYSHAEGQNTLAQNPNSHAEGFKTQAIAYAAHSEGKTTIASGNNSHAEGEGTKAEQVASHAEGKRTIAYSPQTHAEGRYVLAVGHNSHAEGFSSATDETEDTDNTIQDVYNILSRNDEGSNTTAAADVLNKWTTCETKFLMSFGTSSHAEGYDSLALGATSHAEGRETLAKSDNSHAEGTSTVASARSAHAEGSFTEASGEGSHAEGYLTVAQGLYAHAEGEKTQALGKDSHAEGYQTEASGERSHAEGRDTKAQASYTHAEGYGATASKNGAHAEGRGTIANAEYQHVQGKFNIEDTENTYAHIVGNGTKSNDRSNAHTIDWNGNAWFAGNVTIGSDKQILATQKWVQDLIDSSITSVLETEV